MFLALVDAILERAGCTAAGCTITARHGAAKRVG